MVVRNDGKLHPPFHCEPRNSHDASHEQMDSLMSGVGENQGMLGFHVRSGYFSYRRFL
jgi:hypothetical protein